MSAAGFVVAAAAEVHPAHVHLSQVCPRIPQSPPTPQTRHLFDETCQGSPRLLCPLPLLVPAGSLTDACCQETLNARSEYSNSEDDGTAQHRINQYLVKQEIGRGSFGAVHLAVDQYGQEYVRSQPAPTRRTTRGMRRPVPAAAGLRGQWHWLSLTR